jgi:hypothetical protein
MNLVWEEELSYALGLGGDYVVHTLKHAIPNETASKGWFDLHLATVIKRGERKWEVSFNWHPHKGINDKTFRSLKAAKAYAVAIITLEN